MAPPRRSLITIMKPISSALVQVGGHASRGVATQEQQTGSLPAPTAGPQGAERARQLFSAADTAMREWLVDPARFKSRHVPRIAHILGIICAAFLGIVGSLLAVIAVAAN